MTTFRQEEYESFLLEGHKPATDVKVFVNIVHIKNITTKDEFVIFYHNHHLSR